MNGRDVIALRVRIHGRVQGVWYRAWTQQEAVKLRLDGWVRNRRDGTVEAVFAGYRGDIEVMIKACHEGPPLANIIEIEVEKADRPKEERFLILPTT